MTFDYTALNAKGEAFSSFLEADNEADAIRELRRLGYYPTALKKTTKKAKAGEIPVELESNLSPKFTMTLTFTHLISVWFGALTTIFGGAYVCDATNADVTGVMMIIIGIILLAVSTFILIAEHANNKPTTSRY